MSTRIHPQARTTPKIRQEIKDSGLSDREAAKVFNITRATAAKWLKRDDVQDRSHRAHTLHTTLIIIKRDWTTKRYAIDVDASGGNLASWSLCVDVGHQ